jgi:hypothetical protein
MSCSSNMHTPLKNNTSVRVDLDAGASSSLPSTRLLYDVNYNEHPPHVDPLRRLTFSMNGSTGNENFSIFKGNGFIVIYWIDGHCELMFEGDDHDGYGVQSMQEAEGRFLPPPSERSHDRGRKRALTHLTHLTQPTSRDLSGKRRKKNEVCGHVYVGVCVQSRKFIHSI